VPVNINPVFKNWPPTFICQNYPFIFDYSATDADGDSIRFVLCTPLNGALTVSQPNPPENPPYLPVPWAAGFSTANMLGGPFPLTIDSLSGLMTAIPNFQGQFVVGVCANEYRNGKFISTTKRDFQINVVPCPGLVKAFFTNPPSQCGNKKVQFNNLSAGAVGYSWNFGETNSTTDTSTLINPSYTYANVGTYTITLIAYSTIPNCNDTIIRTVSLYPEHISSFTTLIDTCNSTVQFHDTANVSGGLLSTILWSFGNGALSNVRNPIHSYEYGGNYIITLITTSQFGCKDTSSQTITLDDPFNAEIIGTQNNKCYGDCNGSAAAKYIGGNAPYTFLWSDPNLQTTFTATALCAGTYTVTVSDAKGCTVAKTASITSPTAFQKSIASTDAYCKGRCIGTATATISGATQPYSYLWNDPAAQTTAMASGLCSGTYIVSVTDANNCKLNDTVTVLYSDYIPPVIATANYDTAYLGQLIQFMATLDANYAYQWIPTTGLSNAQIYNPTGVLDSGYQTYIVYVTDLLGCSNSDTVSIYIKNVTCIEPELFIPSAFSPNGDGENDVFYVKGNTIETMTFVVYDRWGQKVFESNAPSFGWDGTFKGNALTPAVYDYYVKITCYDKTTFSKKGNITLLK
jgi:gliding motility-associated-like protein